MPNRAFLRAVHCLTHPVIIGAVAVLLLNDHVLRVESPSWLTGKLGDFAWLVFAPIICALVVAWLVPKRWAQQERIVGLISFGFIGAWFALGKTVPAVHAATITVLDAIVGWHGTLGLDPTDLLTLPALLAGWYVWTQPQVKRVSLAPFAWVVLALGVMSTVATSEPLTHYGIVELCQQRETLYAAGGHSRFWSVDGGLTWEGAAFSEGSDYCFDDDINSQFYYSTWIYPEPRASAWLLQDDKQAYRFVPGDGVYSYGSDRHETRELDLSSLNADPRRLYYTRGLSEDSETRDPYGRLSYRPGPFDAEVDRHTGNLVVAMGQDGVLVRTLEGGWQWVSVGPFRLIDLSQTLAFNFLKPELFATALLLLLLVPTVTATSIKRHIIGDLSLFFGWFLWFNIVVSEDFLGTLISIPIGLCLIIGLLLNVSNIAMLFDDVKNSIARSIWIVALIGSGLFLLPYALWISGSVPNYNTAGTFAFILVLAIIIAGNIYIRQRVKALPKKKKPDELITMVFRDEPEAPAPEAEGE